ncbi:MAG TPA: TadE family protein [Acidimicrobiales bacterium]
MSSIRAKRKRRATGDRGAAIVEAAIILPVVVLLVFGIVEIGFLFRSATIVSTSTRSGARLASAQYGSAPDTTTQNTVMDNVRLTVEKDLSSKAGDDTPVDLWIYKADASGNPPSGGFSSCGSPCYVYTWSSVTGHFTFSSGSWASPIACGTAHDSVGVFVRATHKPIGFTSAFGTFTITERTVMRLEPSNSCQSGT